MNTDTKLRSTEPGFTTAFLDELLLNSGQFALFYIIMNLSKDRLGYFMNFGHVALIFILTGQTAFLALKGSKPLYRFLGSLIAPFCYSAIELSEGPQFVLNGAHVYFWIYSHLTGTMQAASLQTVNRKMKAVLEYAISTLNVLAYVFLYYYFDLNLDLSRKLTSQLLTEAQLRETLEFYNMFTGFPAFASDPAHTYILIAGFVLSMSISLSRVKILLLKERIHELFGSYVDRSVSDKIIKHHGGVPERKLVCVLFSDIRDFTPLSERSSAADIARMLSIYFSEWETAIVRHNGIIDKYIGDAIMVVFGVDRHERACGDAVTCAREMLGRMDAIKERLAAEGLPRISDIGIGLHFGNAIVGDVGSATRRNYTVIGDTVNIASRLEGLCKQYQTQLIISESVHTQLPEPLRQEFVFVDNAALKGKAERYPVYKQKA